MGVIPDGFRAGLPTQQCRPVPQEGRSLAGCAIRLRQDRPAIQAIVLELAVLLGVLQISNGHEAIFGVPGIGTDAVAGQIPVGIVGVRLILALHDLVHVV